MKVFIFFSILCLTLTLCDGQRSKFVDKSDREGKFLSLFTIVSFPNDPCNSTNNDGGTCVTSSECSLGGGTSTNTCASGFGVCCVFTGGCNAQSSRNCTYFQNPGYSSSYNTAGQCSFTVNQDSDTCQLRLDFTDFQIASPNMVDETTYGSCMTDQFLVTGNPSGAFGPLCGTNTGQHVYIDVPSGNGPATLQTILGTGTTSSNRQWKVKVSQIPCGATYAAPSGCTQYFTGVSGIIQTYNWQSSAGTASGVHLANQMQVICMRPESGFCSIQYSYDPSATTGDDPWTNFNSFGISGATVMAEAGTMACAADYIIIPNGVDSMTPPPGNTEDRYCGEGLAGLTGPESLVPITSDVRPFILTFISDGIETGEVPTETPPATANGHRGFSLQYNQQPCTSGK